MGAWAGSAAGRGVEGGDWRGDENAGGLACQAEVESPVGSGRAHDVARAGVQEDAPQSRTGAWMGVGE